MSTSTPEPASDPDVTDTFVRIKESQKPANPTPK